MHELSVCRALLDQVASVAHRRRDATVSEITVRIGPLSGVDAGLLVQAFAIARAGTVAEAAELVVERVPVRVRCLSCGAESDAAVNRLLCGACADHRTRLVSGDELLLVSVELAAGEEPRVSRRA